MAPTHPRTFIAEYVAPAMELLRVGHASRHLAAHAIAQVDILCEVVGSWLHAQGPMPLTEFKASAYRKEMAERAGLLSVVRDAHDSHKHGQLRNPARKFSEGQRTEVVNMQTLMPNASPMEEVPIGVNIVILNANDGAVWWVYNLLKAVMMFWDDELVRLGL